MIESASRRGSNRNIMNESNNRSSSSRNNDSNSITTLPSSLTQITDHHDHDASSSSPHETPMIMTMVSHMEAEIIISSIKQFPILEIGSSSFLKMYGYQLEKLSFQAHASASASTSSSVNTGSIGSSIGSTIPGGEDEYVIDLLLTHDKISPLVQTLLAIEAWRIFVLGSKSNVKYQEPCHIDEDGEDEDSVSESTFMQRIAKQGNSLRVAFILHAETTIVSLLTLLFYRKEHVMDIDNQILLSIVDYCARQMSSLAAPLSNNEMIQQQKTPRTIEHMKTKALQQQQQQQQSQYAFTMDEIKYNILQTEFQTAVKTTSLARYVCEHFDSLSISIQSRILNTHDFLMLFIPLIDEPPWTRRRNKMALNNNDIDNEAGEVVWEKYVEQEWKEIPSCDLLQITQCEAQCWIAIFHLTCSNVNCREQYGLDTYRKEQILRIRKFLNEFLMDQIPVLTDVVRYMDELSLMHVPDSSSENGTGMNVLMEQIDQIRESIIMKRDDDGWDEVARHQMESIYSKITDSTDEDLRLIATIYNEENIHIGQENDMVLEPPSIDPFLSPLECISICIGKDENDNNDNRKRRNFEDIFNLTPSRNDEGKIVQTPNGPFNRMKLAIVQVGDFEQFFSTPHCGLKIQANLSFKNIIGDTQFMVDLVLPDHNNFTKKMEWIQFGRLEDKLVLQLGFKCSSDDKYEPYTLQQAFLAQPSEEIEKK